MKIPQRNKPTDAEFVERQLKRTDAESLSVVPKSDEGIEAEMGLAPMIRPQSPADARTESVNALLSKAYEKASQINLTEKEISELQADFPDSDFRRGAGGKENLIYLGHLPIRARLNSVFGMGKWAFIIRRNWTENFNAGNPPKPAVRIYVEGVLIVRGCYAGEGVGDGEYFTNNPSGNYGNAFEAAKSNSLLRCAKEFGIGLQAWDKDFCEAWMKKYKNFDRPEKSK